MAQNDKPVIVTLTCEAREGTETYEIDRAAWDAMSPGERRVMIEDLADTHVANQGGYGWYIDDSGDEAMVGDPGPDPLRELAEWLASQPQSAATVGTAVDAITRAREALGRTEEGT